jgi:hypothetical protein
MQNITRLRTSLTLALVTTALAFAPGAAPPVRAATNASPVATSSSNAAPALSAHVATTSVQIRKLVCTRRGCHRIVVTV